MARFYRSEIGANKPVSTEITGYYASTLVYLFQLTGDARYLDHSRQAARFLVDNAWNADLRTFPFEYPSPSAESPHRAYFFDCGIVIRGLLAVWRHTKEQLLLDIATAAARSMIADFRAGAEYHPIIDLSARTPLAHTQPWSRSPGCYQLKAALAWWELGEITGDDAWRDAYLKMTDTALAAHAGYLREVADAHEIMDRLHAYCYFLEGLTPLLDRASCAQAWAQGIDSVACYLREIAPSFARSDVYAQLLRARIYGAETGGIDTNAAEEEAAALAAFQASSHDARIDGGFYFGRRHGILSPHINPVSTGFGLQALEMWREFQTEGKPPCRQMLI